MIKRFMAVFVCMSLMPSLSYGQIDEVTRKIEQLERMLDAPMYVESSDGTSATAASDIAPGAVQAFLVKPLRWELQKLKIQSKVLRESVDSSEQQLHAASSEKRAIEKKLSEFGIASEESLGQFETRIRSLAEQLDRLAVERKTVQASLKTMQSRENSVSEQMKAQLMLRERLMEQANEELERVNEQFAQGLVSTKELAATKRRLLETEAAVLEMRQEIESQREIAESSRLSQLEDLKNQEMMIARQLELQREIDTEEIRQLLSRVENLDFDVQFARSQRAELQVQLASTELQLAFLTEILPYYENAAAAKPAADSEDSDD